MITRRQLLKVCIFTALCEQSVNASAASSEGKMAGAHGTKIDREALARRHNVTRTSSDNNNPMQVGNGHFAFGADITGLQTFIPFNTMSDWGWHSFPLPPDSKISDFKGAPWNSHGREVYYPSPSTQQPALGQWLYDNPRRLNLARIGLRIVDNKGQDAAPADINATTQTLDLWTGKISSHFQYEGSPVGVETCCHPTLDAVCVRVTSPLVLTGQVSAFVDFPYDDGREFTNFVGDWESLGSHKTPFYVSGNRLDIVHEMETTKYYASVHSSNHVVFETPASAKSTFSLNIRSAVYGSGSQTIDVTKTVVGLVQGHCLQIRIGNNLFGDPASGHVKNLDIKYSLGNQEFEQTVNEGELLTIGGQAQSHRFGIKSISLNTLEFICAFSPAPLSDALPTFDRSAVAAEGYWAKFWRSGGAIDLSGSTDVRWRELERRIVLSQYLLAVNEAGTFPPQESGLVNNGWDGKFHMEMYWWHAAHYALWGRFDLLNRSTGVYKHFLKSSQARAAGQGYKGARWPKMTSPDGHESTHPTNATIIWQQPHPMFFAELEYRARPTKETLEKWKDVLFNTADFLASFAFFDAASDRYILGPPISVVSENTDPATTTNPAFELSYWRFGLRIAQTWRERLGISRKARWDDVLRKLSKLPEVDGVYILFEGVTNMWTDHNFEHPALTGLFGWLPGDGVDHSTILRTAEKVFECWQFQRTWGWDYPMLAMCAARLEDPSKAIDFMLTNSSQFSFSNVGLANGGPYPYMPSNGALLYAAAFMAAGWDGCQQHNAPGFPQDGLWEVKHEGLYSAV
jgi:hypothetical protein